MKTLTPKKKLDAVQKYLTKRYDELRLASEKEPARDYLTGKLYAFKECITYLYCLDTHGEKADAALMQCFPALVFKTDITSLCLKKRKGVGK